jgi:hypothetical protein
VIDWDLAWEPALPSLYLLLYNRVVRAGGVTAGRGHARAAGLALTSAPLDATTPPSKLSGARTAWARLFVHHIGARFTYDGAAGNRVEPVADDACAHGPRRPVSLEPLIACPRAVV